MIVSYKVLEQKDGKGQPVFKQIRITDVLRIEAGPKGLSVWKYDLVNKHELMYFIPLYDVRGLCILPS